MTDAADSSLRIGTAEREAAVAALGDHLAAGRLDIDEYGDRSARASLARTRSELVELFADLPEPHPAFMTPQPVRPDPTWQSRPGTPRRLRTGPPLVARVGLALPLLALLMVLAFHLWFLFLLIPLSGMLFGSRGGYRPYRGYRRYGGCRPGWF